MTDVDKLLEGISTLVRSEFAEIARKCNGKVMVIHGGL